nr:ionotropic receptor [Semanotus bifasciatus]
MKLCFLSFALTITFISGYQHGKRALQRSHEKPQWLKWSEAFLGRVPTDQQTNLVELLKKIAYEYLSECTLVILYDPYTELSDSLLLEKLFSGISFPYIHAQVTKDYRKKLNTTQTNKVQATCVSYMLFIQDVMKSREVLGEQNYNKVIVVARSSQWRVIEFLSNKASQHFINLLVITKSARIMPPGEEPPYILYTHELYIDALGSSKPTVLTTWLNGSFTSNVKLFPKKLAHGFSGHRFVVSVASQPPFVINTGRDESGEKIFEGIEYRLIQILAKSYNFTTDFREASDAAIIGSGEAVIRTIEKNKANLGIAGIYVTNDKINRTDLSRLHSQDCASFVSLSSTALPKYRAILGPFRWTVWLALTLIYLLGIFPLAFSDKHTLRPLLSNPEEIENMFWYVFGTFTNCFTFSGKTSWSKSDKLTTRLLIGFYWLFTIILTATYTGSIIAFITLPIYPAVVDSIKQLVSDSYLIGTLDKGGWPTMFDNSSDPYTKDLLKHLDLVPDVESGLKNTTNYKSFFRKYAFLGSKAQLDYIVRTNFSTKSKRQVLHISAECLVPFTVAVAFPKNSIYSKVISEGISLATQAGLLNKLKADVEWDLMRTATGKLLAADAKGGGGIKALTYEDRALNLDDTQGMFLLLGAGFLIGGASLISEWFGGCFRCFKGKKRRTDSTSSIESNPRSHEGQTPREKLNSIQYSQMCRRLGSIIDLEQNYDIEVTRNNINCIVHASASQESSVEVNAGTATEGEPQLDNVSEEINKIFEDVFGEENVDNIVTEDIIEDTDNKDNKNLTEKPLSRNELTE